MSDGSWYSPAKTILLTGAGFTKNFGGYLGSEMWAAILNQPEIQKDEKLRKVLLQPDNLSYEDVYELVLQSPEYVQSQKQALTMAIHRAYEEMDAVIQDSPPEQRTGCRNFLQLFADSQNPRSRGFVFTLNQDLFLERYYSIHIDHRSKMRIPGLTYDDEGWFNMSAEGPDAFAVRLPDANELANYKQQFQTKGTGQFMYVKLHGSYGWLSHDGSDAMVIGQGKKGRIEKEPLLKWFLSIFKEVLHAGGRNLVIVGYGFGDDHINEIIASAIKDDGLRVHIVCPMEPEEFKNRSINGREYGHEIWEGLCGYYQNKITDFYNAFSFSYATFPAAGKHFIRNLGLA